MVMLAILLATAGAEPLSATILSQWGGGEARSPGGDWVVASKALDPDSDILAEAILSGPHVRRRSLMRFERSVEVRWDVPKSKVLLIERTIHVARIAVFNLGARQIDDPAVVQRTIVRQMAQLKPRLGTLENRRIIFGSTNGTACITVEEDGLPPGQSEGSYIGRRAAFRLDLTRNDAVRIRYCPGVTPG